PDTAARLLARSPNGRRPIIMEQRWENLLFLHWRVPPGRIQETLPAGLTVDTFEGQAWIGLTPFFMRNVRLRALPAIPWFSNFQELNVRTYAFDSDGTPGVWFYSLDCNRAWATVGARVLQSLPYFLAEMGAECTDWIDYSSRRRGTRQLAHFRYRAAGENRPTVTESLEFFLLERYYLFASRPANRTLLRGQIAHASYQLRDAEVVQFSALPAQLDGFSEISDPPDHVCLVDGFDVNIFGQEKIVNR
ncbi:MAG TPA: DUF2071 domain-containing protein, partial [Chthoniobacterales bacterium]